MRLKSILLAGTIVPAIAVLSAAAQTPRLDGAMIVAQAPDKDGKAEKREQKREERQQKREGKAEEVLRPAAQSPQPAQPQAQPQRQPGQPATAQQDNRKDSDTKAGAAAKDGKTGDAAKDSKTGDATKDGKAGNAAKRDKNDRKDSDRAQDRDSKSAPAAKKDDNDRKDRDRARDNRPGAKDAKDDDKRDNRPAAKQNDNDRKDRDRARDDDDKQKAADNDRPRARSLQEVKSERREEKQGNRTIIHERDRTIIKESGRTIIRHDESDRFRRVYRDARVERRGNDTITIIARPGGVSIYTVVDRDGRLVRRYRRGPDGREVIIIDNRPRRPGVTIFVQLAPPVIRIPRERYIVEVEHARPDDIYAALVAAPVERIERAYSLDEIRYSPAVRARMPRVDLDTINFESGSWEITANQSDRLAVIADGIKRALEKNPNEVFLIEGYTDGVGDEDDNLSLSDRRADSVAVMLSEQFQVPGENLTTQGYGETDPKVATDGPERANRRVTVRRITPLLSGQGGESSGQAAPN